MKSVFKSYKRLKKLAQITEGHLGQETIQAFLAKVDEEVLEKIKVSYKDRNRLSKADPETQMKTLAPYFEKFLEQTVEAKANQKSQMSDKLAQVIARKALFKSNRIILPHKDLLMLAQMNPGAMVSLEEGKRIFIYPLGKIKQILGELDQAEVVWDQAANRVKIISADKGDKCAFLLFPQEPSALNGKLKLSVKIEPARDFSITELILKAAEVFIG
jgi:hypothetical protein